ncbi:MAG: beta-phosphoglucomutase family hydrolase [Candidatus Omnitrophica bacterium]|nr:beta-phosphoglucomutase family hydrolase [Candidatus Omnitrophota bacterium]
MALKAGIFDMDGVIVNTVDLHFQAWKRAFSEQGVDFSFEDYKEKVDGIPRTSGARAILPNASDETIKQVCDKKQGYFLELVDSGEIPVYQGTIDLVQAMKADGAKVAVMSSSKNCKPILTKAEVIHYFDAIVDGNDVTRGKPDPQAFNLAAERLNTPNDQCVGVEDAVLGVEAVIAAGMYCIGVDRYKHPERLSKANRVVSDLSEISYSELKEQMS